jgi:magnesium transporter
MIENLENPLQDMIQERVKRDPVIGSSVLLTAATDSMGCFIFLGLATVLLP